MKKNVMMRLAAFLLVAVLVTTCGISGTYAKYTSTQSGSDTARVAKWSFEVGDTNIAQTATTEFKFNLFDTILNEDGNGNDTEVIDGTDQSIIAPGTSGKFEIVLSNTSEVDAQYAINFSVSKNAEIPLWYSTDGENWYQDIAVLNIAASSETQLDYDGGAKDHDTVTVYWKWLFEGTNGQTDSTDTVLGILAAAGQSVAITVTAEVTATQVN